MKLFSSSSTPTEPILPVNGGVGQNATLGPLSSSTETDVDDSTKTEDGISAAPFLQASRPDMSFLQLYNERSQLEAYMLLQAALIGISGGAAVALFKTLIDDTRHFVYNLEFAYLILPLIPALGGIVVGLLALPGSFPPGLKGSIQEVDKDSRRAVSGSFTPPRHPFGFLRKTAASVATLGTGSSLGPEGPSVEVGMSMSRIIMRAFPPIEYLTTTTTGSRRKGNVDESEMIQRGRLLLTCGAAAGVSAGFNAPIAGVFFALEIVQGALNEVTERTSDALTSSKKRQLDITALLVASVLSTLVCRYFVGNEMILTVPPYELGTPLNDIPMYMMFGAACGVVSFLFSGLAKISKSLFDGKTGPEWVKSTMNALPHLSKPAIGGLLCGLIAIPYPQILFFGYETLDALLNSLLQNSFGFLVSLLVVKMVATALAAGSGLVGGTFAPSLFLGSMAGAAFHEAIADVLPHDISGALADSPAYAMVGAGSVLAALFRAPLTASLLLFELTRDYDVILPLMVSAGIGSLVGDILENTVEQEEVVDLRRDRDAVSWGDLSDEKEDLEQQEDQ